jgi:hypothetical protein
LTTTVQVFKKLSQTKRKATAAFGEELPNEFASILPRSTTLPSRRLELEGGNEIIVVRWRPNESELSNGWVTNEQRLSHLSVAEVIFF